MLSVRKPSPERLRGVLESWSDAPLSCTPPLRDEFIADEHAVRLGDGEEVWRKACEALDAWVMFPDWAEVIWLDHQGSSVCRRGAEEQRTQRWEQMPNSASSASLPLGGEIEPGRSRQQPGDIVAMMVRICGLWWVNPCRILRRCDSATTHGFAYGTLPEHAECGEEMFCVEKRPDGSVWYVIRAFSHPRHWMAWLGFPLARWWQCRFVRDSQQNMKEACS
ncbi:MAG: DUF1990 domain-containing protein [Verrucomicrobiaceae bacterium]|nr:DUF1990 domain-containing protein [Verrucomicrobiaceae bacterium]